MLYLFIAYYVLISLLVFGWLFSLENPNVARLFQVLFAITFAVGSLYFIVYRPYTTIGDTLPYVEDIFPQVKTSTSYEDYNTKSFEETERFFYYITKFCTFIGGPRFYLFFVFFLFIVTISIAIYKIWKEEFLLAFYALISIFSFHGLTMNIIRNSLAVGFWYLGIWAFQRRSYYLFALFVLVSIQFHISSILFWVMFLLAKYLRSLKAYVFLFIAALILSVLNFDVSDLISGIADLGIGPDLIQSKLFRYGNKVYDLDYKTGFRIDFVLFNLVFIIYAGALQLLNYKDSFYNHIFRAFLLLTCLFILWFQIPGSDRIGLLSWMLIPFMICYPFLCPNYQPSFGLRLFAFGFIFIVGLFSMYISQHLFL